jgi:hypothetical protein
MEQEQEQEQMQRDLYLGMVEHCDYSISTGNNMWFCTKNWWYTNVTKEENVKSLSNEDSNTLDIILTSLWPIYNCDRVTEQNLLELIRVAHLCGVGYFLKHISVNITRDQVVYMLNNDGLNKLFTVLDKCIDNENIRSRLWFLIDDCYTRRFKDSNSDRTCNIFDKLDITLLSKETLCYIVTHMNGLWKSATALPAEDMYDDE